MDEHEVFQLRKQVLTLMRLEHLESMPGNRTRETYIRGRHWRGSRRFGLVVDSLMGEEELVIKALEDQLVASAAGQRRFDSWRRNSRADPERSRGGLASSRIPAVGATA